MKDSFTVTMAGLKQKERRIAMAGVLAERMCLGYAHKDSVEMIKQFQKNLKRNALGLKKLQPITIEAKKAKDYRYPNSPLVGLGFDHPKRTLINSLRLAKEKNATRLFVSRQKHHESKYTLNELMTVHEKGARIKKGNTIITLPPRPAFTKALEMFSMKRKRWEKKRIKLMGKLINKYIDTGDKQKMHKIIDYRKLGREYAGK